jgi:1,4-alpha-glucan branching enzyme
MLRLLLITLESLSIEKRKEQSEVTVGLDYGKTKNFWYLFKHDETLDIVDKCLNRCPRHNSKCQQPRQKR